MVHSGLGFHQPTHYEGVVTCTVSVPELPLVGSHVDCSQKKEGGPPHQDTSLMELFQLPLCLTTSQLPPQQSSCLSTILTCRIYWLPLIYSSFSLSFYWRMSTIFVFLFLHGVCCASDNIQFPQPLLASLLWFLVYSRPRWKPIRSQKEILNSCKYFLPVLAAVKQTAQSKRNTCCFFSGAENRKQCNYKRERNVCNSQ